MTSFPRPGTLAPLSALALLLLAAPAATAATTTPPGAGTDAPPTGAQVVHHTVNGTDEGPETTLDYWTPQRMAAAEPLVRLLEDPLPLPGTTDGSAEDGTDGSTEGAAEAQSGRTGPARPWTQGGRIVATTGKVYLTMNSRDFICSAAVVPAANASTVVTAGHCLKDGAGSWAQNWTFVPGSDGASRPYGSFAARDLLVPRQWARQADDSYDFGMAVLVPDEEGVHVAEHTGHQEIAFGTGPGERVHAFGYPAAPPFNGRTLHYCSGPTRPDTRGTTASGMPCDMTQGSSGGPWLADFDPTSGTGTITSVVSFKYSDDNGTQYGPRLGDAARDVYETAESL